MDANRLLTKTLDEVSFAIKVIDYAHHEVHEGKTFIASYKSPEGGDIADNGTIRFLLTTGARHAHLTFVVASGGDAELSFYEGTQTSGGTAVGIHNMNRNGIMTPATTVTRDPTVTDAGTRLVNELLPGGVGGALTPGGVARKDTEWNLAENETYMVEVINRAGSAQPMSITTQWYEKD